MSSESFRKRRCIVKKLDFENCIVTNIKTNARGRKKLRARVTREIGEPGHPPKKPSPPDGRSPGQTSPVLIRKSGRGSPVLKRKKAGSSPGGRNNPPPEDSAVEELHSPSSSPVFKLFKKSKTLNDPSQGSSFSESSPLSMEDVSEADNYQIEETTTQDSKDSVRISSVDSMWMRESSLSVCSVESQGNGFEAADGERQEGGQVGKRKHKKSSLLGRLQKLQQKQASEKLLWEHQNRRNSPSTRRFIVVSLWRDQSNVFLKCKSHPRDPSVTYLFLDSRWVPKAKSVKESSILLLHPPWQKVTVEELGATVLMNVICLDVLEETEDAIREEITFEPVPKNQFETLQMLFVDTLFCSNVSGFLC